MSEPLASVRRAGPRGMIAVRCDLGDRALRSVATGVTGLDFPEALEAKCVGEKGLCWMSPDELLVMVPHAEVAEARQRIEAALEGMHALVADVSDMRAVFFVEGSGVRDVLAKVSPADTRAAALLPGRFRRTRIGQVAGAFWLRDGESAEILCFRSVGSYVERLFIAAAEGPPLDRN
ncbi:sarcosine oxidase subunit gamma [Aestuariibius sp. 2305UL40-4]|uniref:sarcosine oxidase subunit gamma n=1 Tax=Aestuariibius violaceus TaxID=3234132 RepID=UPI00345EE6DA